MDKASNSTRSFRGLFRAWSIGATTRMVRQAAKNQAPQTMFGELCAAMNPSTVNVKLLPMRKISLREYGIFMTPIAILFYRRGYRLVGLREPAVGILAR